MTTTNDSNNKPKSPFAYEFGGPWGTLATTLLLPIVVVCLAVWSDVGKVHWQALVDSVPLHTTDRLYHCASLFVAWFLYLVVLERILPGQVAEGHPIVQKPSLRLSYKLNGHLSFWVTVSILSCGWPVWDNQHNIWQFGSFPHWNFLYQNFLELAMSTIVLCSLLSVYLYWDSFSKDAQGNNKILAVGGNSGNIVYDFFMGRELNPRIGTFDWKVFCELRPGLILWMLLNVSCLVEQRQQLGYNTYSMYLVNLFQNVYVWDALFQEKSILTTMDITTDGFGFMLIFGDLAWVPFTYCLQARYLVKHDPHLDHATLAAIVAFHMLGYFIFRSANGQKDAFRRNPDDPKLAHLQYYPTKRGTKLLVSGWWGWARKINYTGDYIMGLSWCMLCGFDSIVPYYYAIYFLILLVHRSIRDDHLCAVKYGKDWEVYKKKVPYRFIPGIV